ncbi:hypothetical protein [Caulobacter sp. NIBR1757]|uniref:hypothetical protein n=1 Tax=Caulobacter sp. NIBR1757 TaxID=3016000 RepID=UPI0022EFDFB0|nr:hypothetical protein [Caulobacter sp. NIBR1757]
MADEFSYFFVRRMNVIRSIDGEESVLEVFFGAPVLTDHGDFESSILVKSRFFNKSLRSGGVDEAQAFFALADIATAFLRSQKDLGFEIYWLSPGDLEFSDIWKYLR